jgi:hypothetical protein
MILFGKIHGEIMAKIKSAMTTKKGHHDATSITLFLSLKNRPFPLILNKESKIVFSLIPFIIKA